MGKYPIFLEMGGRRAVVIGGGGVAVRKAGALLEAGARLVVVSEHIDEILDAVCRGAGIKLVKGRYEKSYLLGAAVVIAATNNTRLNRQIHKDCQELEILCNVVDEPELCDFFVPAVVKRGDLQIAVSTEGDCPAYSGHVRKKLERIFTAKHGEFLAELKEFRKRVIREIPEPDGRKALLGNLVDDNSFEYFVANGAEKWRAFADEQVCAWCGKTAAPPPDRSEQ